MSITNTDSYYEEISASSDFNSTLTNVTGANLKDTKYTFLLPEQILLNSFKDEIILYNVFIPIFGIIIILLNFAVVVSSGLMLKKGKRKCNII